MPKHIQSVEKSTVEVPSRYSGGRYPAAAEEVAKPNSETTAQGDWSLSLQNVLEQPPAAFPRHLLIGGVVFCLASVAWATLGQIEEVGQAQGRLVPQGEVYKINPVESGKVINITAKEGETVQAGQMLVELDTEIANTEVNRLWQLLSNYQVELNQKQGLINKTRLEAGTRSAIAITEVDAQRAAISATEAKISTTRRLLSQMQEEVEASKARLDKLKPLTSTSEQRLSQLKGDVNAHRERVKRLRTLVEAGAISKELLFDAEQALRDRTAAITQSQLEEGTSATERVFEAGQTLRDRTSTITENQGELQQDIAEAQKLEAGLLQKQAEAKKIKLESQQQIQQLEIEKTALKAKIDDTRSSLNNARAKLVQRFLYAPVTGVVSSLNVSNVGEVVQAGQTIAELAPQSAPLVLSARLPIREAGFVKVGMPVQVKLDPYPYQNFGIVAGKVTSISPDSKQDQQMGQFYQVEVALARDYVTANNQQIKFKAGQTATAEIVIRRRRIADVLFDPIKQLQKGGINL